MSWLPHGFAADTAPAGAPPTLTTVRQVQQLSPEEAARRHPVRLRGVVTYFAQGVPIRFLQDETGGTYFSEPRGDAGEPLVLEPGSVVEIDGVTEPGRFVPFVGQHGAAPLRARVLGRAPLPPPRRVSIGELADPQFHSQYIELAGVVRQVTQRAMDHLDTAVVWLKIGTPSATFTAQFFDPRGTARLPAGIIGARVRLRGVYGSTFNEQRQLVGFRLFFDPGQGLDVEAPGPAGVFTDLVLTPIENLMKHSGDPRDSSLVRTGGVLTLVVPGRGFYLEGGSRGLWVETEGEMGALRPGDRLNVAGFPAFGAWNPVLQDATFRVEGTAPLDPPPPITPREARSGVFDCRRVTIDATLLETSELGDAPSVVLQRDGVTFVAAWLPGGAAGSLRLLVPGSRVRLTAICLNRRLESRWPAFELRPIDPLVASRDAAFRLLVGSPGELTVLRAPSWWTPGRIWTLAGVVVALALAVLGWNVSLHRQVAAQTEIIRTQVAREAVHEDRTRIARELHDTLEQELTGIAVQLDAASDRLADSPATAATALDAARALLRHTRTEARRSVWDLRAALLEEGDLGTALQAVAAQLPGGPEIRVTVEGTARRLPAPVENNLLRIGTEAMTNAVKHASARLVAVRLGFAADAVILEVRDDGCGFDASRSTELAAGHFGWLGIRERAERLGAQLTIDSRPGAGTRVNVRVPVPGAEPSAGVETGGSASACEVPPTQSAGHQANSRVGASSVPRRSHERERVEP